MLYIICVDTQTGSVMLGANRRHLAPKEKECALMNSLHNQSSWNQLNELEGWQPSPRSLFSRLLKSYFSRAKTGDFPRQSESQSFQPCLLPGHWPEGQENGAHWIPLVEISEEVQGYLIKAELPRVKKRDVKLTLESGMLTIAGSRKFKKNSKRHHRVERNYGSFVHRFPLPDDATPEVTAEFKDGVLEVHVAKNGKAGPQQVEVEANAPIPNYCSSGWGINE
jgi:HSP20 family protein